ncbi:hypothetical protein FK219_000790 [Chryseoglobus sp. KN1116]|uniref:Uncharacterized protein n=1 Tax=Microcella pacifica TaxID=2591847 RepID=A0A9E5MHN3_9MICO|nr:hypothetical protein [Microcella pacifica]
MAPTTFGGVYTSSLGSCARVSSTSGTCFSAAITAASLMRPTPRSAPSATTSAARRRGPSPAVPALTARGQTFPRRPACTRRVRSGAPRSASPPARCWSTES